ncbi:MAG: hypothetical protein JWR26_4864 [Pedosphaera sp.]|nr:hypothetical protein [Pedosphaera sp.]
MMVKATAKTALSGCVAAFCLFAEQPAEAGDASITQEQFLKLQQQNEQLQKQMQKQQELIDALTHKVADIQKANSQLDQEMGSVKAEIKDAEVPPQKPLHFGKVDITGEGGLAFFQSQSNGQHPNPEFRIDEARLFLEAPVWKDVYFFTELDLATRETTSLDLNVGQLYLDFEDVSQLWGRDRMLNLRVGRFDVPFGEEYLERFAIDNPLISHSVSDIWGQDDGVEFYGSLGRVQWVLAVQNGGGQTSQALQGDKAVTGRVSYDPTKWLHLSVSGMRTGDQKVQNETSAVWFGGGWFRPLDPSGSATTFHANLAEGDVQVHLGPVIFKAAGGYINSGDNDPSVSNRRDVYYYYLEGIQSFTSKLYGAARFSQIFANNGFPIVGDGKMGEFFFGPTLTTDYWRLSLATGYRFSPNLLVKGEYSFNQGREVNGIFRGHENAFALEAAFRF